jgi:nicotinamide riboside transporter PnuC
MSVFQFFNEHSYLIISGTLLAIGAVVLLIRKARRAWLLWIGLALIGVAGWFALRTGSGTQLNSVDDYEAAIRTGQPMLVEFYSDY